MDRNKLSMIWCGEKEEILDASYLPVIGPDNKLCIVRIINIEK